MKKLLAVFSVLMFAVAAFGAATTNLPYATTATLPVYSSSNAPTRFSAYSPNAYSINLSNAAATAAITSGLYQDPTNNWSYVFGPTSQRSLELQCEFADSAATSTAYILYYQLSTDGVTYDTTLTPAGFTVAALNSMQRTNIDMQGCGYIKFAYMTNANASINGTNNFIRFPYNTNAK